MQFYGLPYPITRSPKGLFRTTTQSELIRSDLLSLLLTKKGERVMLPDFGTDLSNLLFEPNDDFVAEEAKRMIIDAITTWEPRVQIESIETKIGYDSEENNPEVLEENDHVLYITILFRSVDSVTEVQELRLNVPLNNG